ncbi:jmjC domain-containing protein 5-like [Pocillopora damicornis]|uniref:jmjC domain-containing protein 5-like n=1 Tax=Pocillopora damicornis TaxID=46731 RepID=UPI000F552C5E|nr:jmjC domain-containing protein 5-like [Pocillopora damicornis]
MHGEIEELNFVPNGKDFYEHFLRKRRPLIMRGAIKNWPAVQNWANESYLREKYGEVVFDVQLTKKYEGEFPAKKTMNLNEFLTIYKSKQVYLDCPFPHSDMIKDIFVPYCLQCEEVMPTIASTHLLFSSGNTSSSCHMDGYENLLSLIAGKKEVLVASPKYVEYFYPRNHTTVNIESPIDPEAVNLEKFPKLAQVPFHKGS